MNDLWAEIRAIKRQIDLLRTETRIPSRSRRSMGIEARYTTSAGQSIPDGAYTIVDFGTKSIDTHSLVTTGAAWKFTAAKDMYVSVAAMILYTTTTAWAMNEVAELILYKNGSAASTLSRRSPQNTSGTTQYLEVVGSDVISLAAGDYIDIRTYQTSGGALALYNSTQYNHVAIAALA